MDVEARAEQLYRLAVADGVLDAVSCPDDDHPDDEDAWDPIDATDKATETIALDIADDDEMDDDCPLRTAVFEKVLAGLT